MLKLIGVTAATSLLPKLVDKVGEGIDAMYDSFFGDTIEDEPIKDNSKITQQQALYIQYYHKAVKATAKEKTEFLNNKFGLNKSISTYTRIWNGVADTSKFPEGDEIT